MEKIIEGLETILKRYHSLFKGMPVDLQNRKPKTEGWSIKQELGHLVDSAQNNLQRFIRIQYQDSVHVHYNADEWVRINDYANTDWYELVELWYLLNSQVCRVLKGIPASALGKKIDVGSGESKEYPLSYIAEDYIVHMQHHIDHIFGHSSEGPMA